MYDTAEQQQSPRVAPATRGIFTAFGARHIQGVAATRWVVAACFVVCAVVLLAIGQWWGAFLFAPAALNGSLAYLVPRWNPRRDTPDNARLSM
jgi:membrane protein implicated in regulation of membrane protease activity